MTLSKWINQKLFLYSSAYSEDKTDDLIKTEKNFKLSVVTQFFPPDYAATGQLLEELTRELGNLGVDIEVFTSQPGYAFRSSHAPSIENLGKVQVQRSRTAQLWPGRIRGKAVNGVLFTLRAVLHLLRNGNRFNLLLLTTAPPFLPFIGYLAHIWLRIPYVCIIYDLYPDIAIALKVISKDHWLAKLWQKLNKLVWQKSKALIVLSPAMKMRVTAICPQVADKVSVIHSWGDPDLIIPIAKKENWFAWKHNLVDKFTVIYSGNMGRCHDMDTILEAAKLLQDEPIQFVFIGSGAKKEELIKDVNRLRLKNFVFLPYQDKEVLPFSLTAGDLSLVSVDAGMESLVAPSKLYPALASGRPIAVICSQYSYLRQMITEANCGDTFENGDSHGLAEFIRLLSQDQELAKRMGRAGRQYMRSHFTPQIISRQYLQVLQQSIGLYK
ncbi:glycosyltransferase family 4 protein [Fischerella thermalis]|uniref:Glycosyltransferase WbuB n=1 Tax=Fischerella thermalis CCMEE 5318 TaxID=2019666 RepID=A0A2N6LJP9_9CYAN|nr:glycosyltransferase family 4 protein [Fischerella thermalis]PMB19334.1 glycosyltransferase WbuB [Fischerella thermalis CCMEE 5319]PMB24840.1 glycosyltransferase WbuB [Fischerella thermalis CCMEE 5318]